MGWYVGCFYIIWSENYSEKLKIERFLESNHGNRSQHLAFVWKSSSNFELLSSQKFLWYKLETLGIVGSIIWLYCAQILCSSRLNCGRYSSFGDAVFFLVTLYFKAKRRSKNSRLPIGITCIWETLRNYYRWVPSCLLSFLVCKKYLINHADHG